MPAERFQEDRLALSWTDVGDLGEDDRMVTLGNLIHHMTFDPARAIGEHREAGRGPLGLHLLEGSVEHQLGDVLRALSDERYREGTQDVAELVLDGAFEKVKTERTSSGLPVLADGAGWIECHLVEQIPQGDHPIVLAEVSDAGPGKGKPIFLDSLGWHYGG